MSKDTALISELKEFFSQQTLPKTIAISPAETIVDIPKFLDSHFHMVETYEDPKKSEVFLLRLVKLKEKLAQGAQ